MDPRLDQDPSLSTLKMPPKPARKQLEYLLILDFEATCGDTIKDGEGEIIEFPTLLYDLRKNEVQTTFHEYVKPIRHPTLTEFCTGLTGITQETVDAADTFPAVWSRFQAWLKSTGGLENPTKYAFLTCGDWDLKTMLPEQLVYTARTHPGFEPTIPPPMDCWVNIKKSFARQYQLRKAKGMAGMLNYAKLGLEGKHHSGIDDCRNISRIVTKMREDKWEPNDDLHV